MGKVFKKLILFLIKIYRITLSPFIGRECRFYPSCSVYAQDALNKKKLLTALYLIIHRILRCNPFCKGGYDPVKED